MMRTRIRIVALFLALGLAYWLADSLTDSIGSPGALSFWSAFQPPGPREQLYVRLAVSLLFLAAGVILSQHVVRRQQAEIALRRSEADYRGLFENAHDAIIIFAPEGEKVLEVNQRACQIYGFTREEFIGLSLRSLTKDVARGEECLKQVLRQGAFVQFESVQYRKDGSELFIEINSSLVDYQGRVAVLSINRDVTDRTLVRRALQESEEKFRQLAEHIEDVFWVANGTGEEFLYLSPAYETLWGRPRPDFRIGLAAYLDGVPRADQGSVLESWRRQSEDGEPGEIEHRVVRPDGAVRWVWARRFPIRDAHGKVCRYVGITEDITKRKQAAAERERLDAQLRETTAEVKALSGLLPICASCKMIRDGNDQWHPLEDYLQEHAHAEFSHGICPRCMQTLYPGYQI